MRIFDGFNEAGKPCPICGTNENKKTVLIPISGTQKGKISEAMAIHLDCLLDRDFYILTSADKRSYVIISVLLKSATEEELF